MQASATLVRNKINTHAKEHKIQHQTATAGINPLDKFETTVNTDCRIKTKRHKHARKGSALRTIQFGASTHQLYWGQNHFETFQPLYEQGHNVDIRENTHDHARSHTILIDYHIHFLLNKLRNTRNKCRVNSAPAPASLWKPEWDPRLIGWVCYGHLEFAELEGTFMKIARCLSVWMKALFFRFLGHHFSLCKELPGPVSESNRKADQL